MSGQAFQLIGRGIVQEITPEGLAIGAPKPAVDAAATQPATATEQGLPTQERAVQTVAAPEERKPKKATSAVPRLTEKRARRQWVKELRARKRELENEIKQLRSLEDELVELKRLIAAAEAPPANVHRIRKSS